MSGGAEPQLRYERLGGDLKAVLAETRVTVLALSSKLLAIGTSDGSVAILDYSGNQVRGASGRQSVQSARCDAHVAT